MFVLKGFIEHALFVSDTPGVVSTIGELSTLSMTYARVKNTYLSTFAPDMDITTFISVKDDTPVKLTIDVSDQIGRISKYVYDHTINSQTQVFAVEILQNLTATFNTEADNFECGEIVTDGDYTIPEWISWHSKLSTIDAENTFKIWFSDTSFQQQYDNYEIVVIPALDPVDHFFNPISMIKTELSKITPSDMMDRIQIAKENCPETVVRAETYLYYDPYNATSTVPTTWNFLIYGNAGNNIDSVNDALIAYILAHSTHTRDEWAQLIPEIFKHTEFVIVPQWNQYGIPNRTLEAGIYSPICIIQSSIALINKVIKTYSTDHINTNVALVANPWKSIALLIVGGPDNRDSKFKISDVFPDYIAVQSTSNDFIRMSQSTQDWATLLGRMLIVAETMTTFSAIPSGMSKTDRSGVKYLTCRYQNINYLVATKLTMKD